MIAGILAWFFGLNISGKRYWNFYTQQFLVFTQNGAKSKKHPVAFVYSETLWWWEDKDVTGLNWQEGPNDHNYNHGEHLRTCWTLTQINCNSRRPHQVQLRQAEHTAWLKTRQLRTGIIFCSSFPSLSNQKLLLTHANDVQSTLLTLLCIKWPFKAMPGAFRPWFQYIALPVTATCHIRK